MVQRNIGACVLACVCLFSLEGVAVQQPAASTQQSAVAVAEPEAPRVVLQAETTASVLRLMKFSGALRDRAGNARTGAVGLTFALYKDQQGGSPLWLEVQNAQLDEQGRYNVLLGSTKSEGLPLELFSSGEARWLGVQLNLPDEEEQPRVLLVSVPYALKAADAETLGGKPPSAFLLAEKEGREAAGTTPEAGKEAVKEGPPREGAVGPIAGEGSLNFVAKFTGPNNIGNGSIFDNGLVGIGTATPNVKLSLGTDIAAQKLALYDGLGDFYGLGVQPGRVVLHTANTERMAITSAGNVGIGTAAPGARLAVTGSGTGDARFGDPGCGGNYTGIWLNQLTANCTNYNLTSSPGDQTLYVNRPAGAGIEFREANAAQMVVKAGGKVGIGTTAPNVKLSLGTDITAQKLALYDGAGDFYGLGVQGGRLVVHTANTERMAITSSGNVGIGTAGPLAPLTVGSLGKYDWTIGNGWGDFSLTNGSVGLSIGVATGGGGTGDVRVWPQGGTARLMLGNPTNGDTLAVSNGQVGIGTISPCSGAKMHVRAAATGNCPISAAVFGQNSGSSVAVGTWGDSDDGIGLLGFSGTGKGADAETTSGNALYASVNSSSCTSTTGACNIFVGQANDVGFVNKVRIDRTGKGFFNGGTQTGGADFAESVEVLGERDLYGPGDVLVIDSTAHRRMGLARDSYSTRVAGIYSTKAGVLASPRYIDDPRVAEEEIPMAMVGIVPCKVSAENGPIEAGDLLVTSSLPGHAMKGTDRSRMLGAIVGKALEPLREGAGVIEVLVTLQ